MVDHKDLHYCDTSTLKHLNLQKAFRVFVANSSENHEKPDQIFFENVTAADNGTFTH